MRIEELQQGRLSFGRLLSGTWDVCRGNFLPFLVFVLIFGAPVLVTGLLLPGLVKPSDLASALRSLALGIPLGLIAGYGALAISSLVERAMSGEPADLRRAMSAALAATPRYLPASIVALAGGAVCLVLFIAVMCGLSGAFIAAYSASHRLGPPPAIILAVVSLTGSVGLIPAVFFATAIGFFPVIAVLRAVPWHETLSRSWALVRGRWWRVFWVAIVLNLPAIVLSTVVSSVPTPVLLQVGVMLVQMLLSIFATTGMTLLFLNLESLGPAIAPVRSDPAPASTETNP
jgi:hypothetical protein